MPSSTRRITPEVTAPHGVRKTTSPRSHEATSVSHEKRDKAISQAGPFNILAPPVAEKIEAHSLFEIS